MRRFIDDYITIMHKGNGDESMLVPVVSNQSLVSVLSTHFYCQLIDG